jgi:dihydrofolate reductase
VTHKKIALIAAMAENRIIGKNNRLPWVMPADWDHFHRVTRDKPFIMGRNSYEAPDKLLSKRISVILTNEDQVNLCKTCCRAESLEEALEILKEEPEIFILGGQSVFEQSLPMANYMYLTIIHAVLEGDTVFPEFNENEWELLRDEFHKKDQDNPYDYSFRELIRKS